VNHPHHRPYKESRKERLCPHMHKDKEPEEEPGDEDELEDEEEVEDEED
jgi:hypothetical protein